MKKLLLFICVCLLVSAGTVSAVVPIWSNTVENDAITTAGGGEIMNPPSSYVPGSHGNAFAGNGSVYADWDNAEVAALFDGAWNNTLGSTIDLYFSGDHWDTHSGDSGLWSVVDRYGGNDGFMIAQIQNGSIRITMRDSYTNLNQQALLTGITLANDTTYHLTARQFGTDIEVYLDGGAYSNAAPVYTASDFPHTISFPEFNDGSVSGDRRMAVGTRAIFWEAYGGHLQSGEWVDSIQIFNGYYTPAELPEIPEPATVMLLGLGGLALIRRRRA